MKTNSERSEQLREVRGRLLNRIRSITKSQVQSIRSGRIADFIESLGEKERHYQELAHVLEDISACAESSEDLSDEMRRMDADAAGMIKEIHSLEEGIQDELTSRLETVQQEIGGIRNGRKAMKAYSMKSARTENSIVHKG